MNDETGRIVVGYDGSIPSAVALGSVSHGAIHRAPCPVALIRGSITPISGG
jgi:nucleotide-binding universal stress UspA family protein